MRGELILLSYKLCSVLPGMSAVPPQPQIKRKRLEIASTINTCTLSFFSGASEFLEGRELPFISTRPARSTALSTAASPVR